MWVSLKAATSRLAGALITLGLAGCQSLASPPDPIVGTWLVRHPEAPFPLHLYVFAADGTLHQANPDAGDPAHSDSDGKGIWRRQGQVIQAKWVEILADRATHHLTGTIEVALTLTVNGDLLTGTASATSFDANENPLGQPARLVSTEGRRLTLP